MYSERTRLRLEGIVEHSDRIANYIAGHNFSTYLADIKTADAVERCLSRVTEAVIQIGESEVERLGLGAPWRVVRAMGNKLRHEYRRINPADIFSTAHDDLPSLRDAATRALASR